MPGTDAGEHAGTGVPGYAPVDLAAERVQRIGVKTEKADRRALTRRVRTVGVVRPDETRESHVHVKWTGWIEEFFVNFVGKTVKKGDPLFSVYSPELVTAQQEFLIALRGSAREGGVASPLVTAAREKLRLWDVPEERIAALEKGGEIQRFVTVRAPRDGTVISLMALPGMYVEPSMHLYTIADLSRVWVQVDLYEYEAPTVSVGQRASFTPVGSPATEVAAAVAFLAPTVDPMTRTVKVRLEAPNEDGDLRPGAYGTVRLETPLAEAVTIPLDSVIDTGERRIVFVALGGGAFEPRSVRLGAAGEGRVQVLEGIREGEDVVTRAQFLLDSESRLRASAGRGAGHGGH
jgi:Cu(I)/Ag(I) efflux system membrane fusion protein